MVKSWASSVAGLRSSVAAIGFHPELTGRENVYLSGNILGMSKKEIDRKFDEIVEFSGVEKFIDTLCGLKQAGKRLAAYGAAVKGVRC